MDQEKFKEWLVTAKGHALSTAGVRASNVRTVENHLGDLDELFRREGLDRVLEGFAYSTADEREGKPNPSPVPIDGVLRTGLATLRQALSLYYDYLQRGDAPAPQGGQLSRAEVEAAMDAFESGAHQDVFGRFGEPSEYWVLSTRKRLNRAFPSKPVNFWANGRKAGSGGWGGPHYAAAALHNAGFVIVDQSGKPLQVPEKDFLHRGADRIRLCALNYFIEPARENSQTEVSIAAGDLARLMGLENQFPNICQALGGEKFLSMAHVPPPAFTQPNPSSSTVFTYRLSLEKGQNTMTPVTAAPTPTTNLILYGPPGTGKTWATAWEAVRLCLGDVAAGLQHDRPALMAEYRRLVGEGRIQFVTFHQSLSYEEFVEGLRPAAEDGGGFRLEVEPGILWRMARRAATSRGRSGKMDLAGRKVFKMSIGNTGRAGDAVLFEDAIAGGYTVFGFDDLDWSDDRFADRGEIARAMREDGDRNPETTGATPAAQMTDLFRNGLARGDILVVSKGNSIVRAIGEVTGDYEFHPREQDGYSHRRAVRWLWSDPKGIPVTEVFARPFVQRTLYPLPLSELNIPALERYMNSGTVDAAPEPFVLIIDEINRANISKVFGELITLLEPDKRLGQENEIRLTLPYSKEEFGLPANLHMVGTMNTADRSIALLDTALRRRFGFRELMPDPSALPADIDGINLPKLLTTLNDRIEYLFDREHQIGHAYFTACASRKDVAQVMRYKVIPLLAEYFYEDWSKVAAVLGDVAGKTARFLEASPIPVPPGLADDALTDEKLRWRLRDSFDFAEFVA